MKTILFAVTVLVASVGVVQAQSPRDSSASLELLRAASQGDAAALSQAIKQGADTATTDAKGYTALTYAADRGDLAIVDALLSAGADINTRSAVGGTPLVYAATRGHTVVVRTLLDRGADVNAASTGGVTALIGAARAGRLDVVSLLIKAAGIKLDASDMYRWTAVMHAATRGHKDIVQVLLAASAMDTLGINKELVEAARDGNVARVKELIAKGAVVNAESNGETALRWAAMKKHVDVVDVLLESGAAVNMTDAIFGGSALGGAVIVGDAEIAKRLLSKGADPNEEFLSEPLIVGAAEKGNIEIVRALLEKGAKVDAKDKQNGETALLRAVRVGDIQIVRVREVVRRPWTELVSLLIGAGADVNTQNDRGETALLYAALWGHSEIVDLLLQRNAKPDPRNQRGTTALMLAASAGHFDVVKILLSRGADVSATDQDRQTALSYAEAGGYSEIATLLKGVGKKQ